MARVVYIALAVIGIILLGIHLMHSNMLLFIRKTKYLPGASSIVWICAAILVGLLKIFIFLMKVGWKVFVPLALMGIILLAILLRYSDMHEHVWLHVEPRNMAQLLYNMVQASQWKSWMAKRALLFAALQHWQIWAFPGLFVLLFGFLWCIRKTKYLPGASSIVWICAAILVAFLKIFIFLLKVAWKVFVPLAFMGIVLLGIHHMHGDMHEHVWLHMEHLSRDVAQLLRNMVQVSQWQSWVAKGALLFSALLHWQIWAFPGLFVLLFGFLWCIRNSEYLPGTTSIIWICAAILVAFLKIIIFLLEVARMVFVPLALMGIILLGIHHMYGDIHEHVRLHMEHLSRDMAQRVHNMVQVSQWQSWAAKGALLFAALQHWQIWAFPGLFVLLFGFLWCIRKMKYLPGTSSIICICAAIRAAFLKTFIFLLKVARMVFVPLALMGIILLGIHLMYGDMHEHVWLHMEHLSRDMAQLLHNMVQGSQWQSWAAKGALLFAALQHWQIWAFPGLFVLLFGFLWCIRKTKYLPGASSIVWICAAILVAFLKIFIFVMKVVRMVFVPLALMGIILLGIHHMHGDLHERVQLHMEHLSQDMAQLLHNMVQVSQWQSWVAKGAQLFAALLHWQIWAFPGLFVLLFGFLWCIRNSEYLPGTTSIIWICAAILVAFLQPFIFLLKVARMVFVPLALMGIILSVIHLRHGDMHEHVWLHMEHLSQDMAQLLNNMVQGNQRKSWMAKGALLFSALQHWQIWAFSGVFVLLFGFLWCIRKTKYLPGRSSIVWICAAIRATFLKPFFFLTKVARMLACGSSSQKRSRNEEEDDDEEEDSDPDEAWDLGRVWADHTEWPAPHVANKCQLVEELVDDVLRTCRGQTCHSFMPRLQPAIGICVSEEWSAHDENVSYHLLVPVRPPPGHTFHVELDDVETVTSNSCVRVQLECTCTRERLLGDMLCFVHHDQEELREKQEPSLLDTFCTGSYLHVEKSTLWLQNQVKAAWRCLPQSRDCRLELLPSSHSCKMQLITPSNYTFNIEMTLGVQLDEPGTFLSIE